MLYEASARKLAVPDRLAVIGSGNLSASAHTYPSSSTVAVDGQRIGREAARMRCDRLDGDSESTASRIIDVGSYIFARDSG